MNDTARHDVVGIGNALVDVITHVDDRFVERCALNRGTMTLIDEARAHELYDAMGPAIEVSGGSAANTMVGIASFGGRAGYIGKVRDDQLGEVFAHDLRSTGVAFDSLAAAEGPSTGRCLIVVTPDAQRTMNTYLGVSAFLGPEDVDEEIVADAAIVYLEGYLWDLPEAKEAYRKAAAIAHAAERRVSLTLSDPFCVDRHRAEWRELVRNDVDVLFANEMELCSLYECELEDALRKVAIDCEIAAITLGADGSMVLEPSGCTDIAPEAVEELVDTTGAGDLYAAGFLFGLTRGADPAECGRLGSLAASEVISHTGARPEQALASLVG